MLSGKIDCNCRVEAKANNALSCSIILSLCLAL